jgi:hypothetical protein
LVVYDKCFGYINASRLQDKEKVERWIVLNNFTDVEIYNSLFDEEKIFKVDLTED